jgi:hypothetical protein
MRSLQEDVESEDLFVVARESFEIRSKILKCEELTHSAALILSGSLVSATLSNINKFAIIVQRNIALDLLTYGD